VLFPINLLITLIIRINSPGQIFYKQIRVGLNGVRFTLIKFRTMYSDSENETGPVWAQKQDHRITGAGKLLRKYHLDEIPQLLNVLYGDMSIIGPRPERPEIIDILLKEIPYYARRHRMKPGITGWAQIMRAYDNNISDVRSKLKLDFYYIENMSILLDLKIILLTILIIIKGKGQ
jgi:lipopolysaccharide/colanic/teichoic acid biosynthesis glycosyltransferase